MAFRNPEVHRVVRVVADHQDRGGSGNRYCCVDLTFVQEPNHGEPDAMVSVFVDPEHSAKFAELARAINAVFANEEAS